MLLLELQRNVPEPMVLSIVGNKIDLESQRQVTKDEAHQYAASIGGSYFESSAVKDEGEILFKVTIADRLCRQQHRLVSAV
jgi:Ras-related protein Rab-21